MTFGISGACEMALVVNGVDLQLGAETVKSCTAIEDVKMTTPTVSIEFVDNKLQSQNLGLFQDGAPIKLTLGDGKSSTPLEFDFMQWNIGDGTMNTAGPSATLNGIANLIPWVSKVITKSHKGNASDVVQQLAQEAGIKLTDITGTNDSMTWLPDGRAIGQYVRNLVDRAWIGSSSCPHVALTSQNGQWMLRLKDIMQKGGATKTFSSVGINSSDDIPVWTHNINSHGGPLNTYTTYGHQVVQEMLNGNVNVWQNFSFSSISSLPGISSAAQEAVGIARTFFHPPDTGNTHKNYAQALHQGRMSRSTYSVSVTVLTDVLSGVKLMDDVMLKLADNQGNVDGAYSGMYKIVNIARHLSKAKYVEKITMSSQGTGQS